MNLLDLKNNINKNDFRQMSYQQLRQIKDLGDCLVELSESHLELVEINKRAVGKLSNDQMDEWNRINFFEYTPGIPYSVGCGITPYNDEGTVSWHSEEKGTLKILYRRHEEGPFFRLQLRKDRKYIQHIEIEENYDDVDQKDVENMKNQIVQYLNLKKISPTKLIYLLFGNYLE